MMSGTLNVWRNDLGTVTEVSFTEREDLGEWQETVFEMGLTGMVMDWGAGGTVEVRPVLDAPWARAVVELFGEAGWNAVGPHLKGLGFTV